MALDFVVVIADAFACRCHRSVDGDTGFLLKCIAFDGTADILNGFAMMALFPQQFRVLDL